MQVFFSCNNVRNMAAKPSLPYWKFRHKYDMMVYVHVFPFHREA